MRENILHHHTVLHYPLPNEAQRKDITQILKCADGFPSAHFLSSQN